MFNNCFSSCGPLTSIHRLVCILILKSSLHHVLNERKKLKKYMRNIRLLLKPVKGTIYVTRILLPFQVNPLLKSLLVHLPMQKMIVKSYEKEIKQFYRRALSDDNGLVIFCRPAL